MKVVVALLLVLIVLILAPWLIWFFAAGAAVYGLILGIVAVVSVLLMVGSVLWPHIRAWNSKRRVAAQIHEGNRIFREKYAAQNSELEGALDWVDDLNDSRRPCGKCQMEMKSSAARCPSCGHKVKTTDT